MTLHLVSDDRPHPYEPCAICGNLVYPEDGMWWNPEGTLHNLSCAGYSIRVPEAARRVELAAAGLALNCDLLEFAAKQVREAIRLLVAAAPRGHRGTESNRPEGA